MLLRRLTFFVAKCHLQLKNSCIAQSQFKLFFQCLVAVMQADINSNQVAKVRLILFSCFLLFCVLKICIQLTYAFLFVSNYVVDQLGAFMQHTFIVWASLCFATNGEHAIHFQICLEEGYIHLSLHSYSESLSRPIIHIIL